MSLINSSAGLPTHDGGLASHQPRRRTLDLAQALMSIGHSGPQQQAQYGAPPQEEQSAPRSAAMAEVLAEMGERPPALSTGEALVRGAEAFVTTRAAMAQNEREEEKRQQELARQLGEDQWTAQERARTQGMWDAQDRFAESLDPQARAEFQADPSGYMQRNTRAQTDWETNGTTPYRVDPRTGEVIRGSGSIPHRPRQTSPYPIFDDGYDYGGR